jgi:hypothetical protein
MACSTLKKSTDALKEHTASIIRVENKPRISWLSCPCLLLVHLVTWESQWELAVDCVLQVSQWKLAVHCDLQASQWELVVHCVLQASQWELTFCFAFPSCFLCNPKLRQVDYSACYLLHTGFLFGLFCNPEDAGDMFLWNVGWLHRIISLKKELLIPSKCLSI